MNTQNSHHELNYYCHPHHRSKKRGKKSQWIISKDEERGCFECSNKHGWVLGTKGWGLHLISKKPNFLGKLTNGKQTKIAMFVKNDNTPWHGYPINYMEDSQRPNHEVLTSWFDHSYIKKSELNRIMSGKKCALLN